MKIRDLYITICLLAALTACNKNGLPPEPDIPGIPNVQQGDALVFNFARSGNETAAAPDGEYGLFAVEHTASSTAISWSSIASGSFYSDIENRKGTKTGSELTFVNGSDGKVCRYPINDSLSVFLYYPYTAGATPTSIPIARQKIIEDGVEIADKYPDYLAGQKAISVIAGTPEPIPNNTTVSLKHLMARVHFEIENPATSNILLTRVTLKNIPWTGTINPQRTEFNNFFTSSGTPEDLVLAENVVIEGTPAGQQAVPQYIPIKSKYNYSDLDETIPAEDYDDQEHFEYYLLVPPLNAEALATEKVALEIVYSMNGSQNTYTIELGQITLSEWESGKSYCYTIIFNATAIDRFFGVIEDWQEELFIAEEVPLIGS